MKIAYIIYLGSCISGKSNGIRMQALSWKNALERLGHEVCLIDCWGDYNWKDFDVIHVFNTRGLLDLLPSIYERNKNIVLSPIIDSEKSTFVHYLASHCCIPLMRMYSPNAMLRKYASYISLFFTRSDYESNFLIKSYGVLEQNIVKVPLSYREIAIDSNSDIADKEEFCLHVSSITQKRKNVMRLIQASVKYRFKLVLAGSFGTEKDFEPFRRIIEANKDVITYLGFVTDENLLSLYKRAKVFALPSIYEGVGLVALEAARYGCEIVVTNIGGPKEYYEDNAVLVNPYSIDSIGRGVIKALSGKKQPKLKAYIESKYNIEACVKRLENAYLELNASN